MFKSENTFSVEITDVKTAEAKFNKSPNAFDVCIYVQTSDGQSGWWRGEVSGDYGVGAYSSKTRAEITFETLTKLGLPANDISQLEVLMGVKTTATTKASVSKANGKTYYNIAYLGGGERINEIGLDKAQALMKDMFSSASAASTKSSNPFLK
jgi:hypothetical protein